MISLETTGALNAIWCCAQQLVPDILCTVWFAKLYFSLLEIKSGENTESTMRREEKHTVVLSARSFSMTSISWSFCSGSKLRGEKNKSVKMHEKLFQEL